MRNLERFFPLPLQLVLQACGVGIWWEWFNGFAFGSGDWAFGLIKVLFLTAVLTGWSYSLPQRAQKTFGWDLLAYQREDAWVGMGLALLPLLILLEPYLAAWVKPFPMKLTAFAWLPWWGRGLILKPSAFAALSLAGVVIVSVLVAKFWVALKFLRRSAESPDALNPRRLFMVGALAGVLLLSWPACFSAPRPGEVPQLLLLQSIAFDAGFDVEPVLKRADYTVFHPVPDLGPASAADPFSRLFLPVAPGMPLMMMTFFLLQGRWLAAVLLILFAAGAAAQLYGFCRERGFSPLASFAAWAVALGSAPLMLYGYQQGEVAAGAFFLLWGLRNAFLAGDPQASNTQAQATAAGFAAGLLWLGGLRFIVPSLVLLAVLVRSSQRRQRLGQLIAPIAIFLVPAVFALLFYFNVYALVFQTDPGTHLNRPWELGFWRNALALVGDRFAGLIWNAPIWIAGLAGTAWLGWRRRDPAAGAVLLILAALAGFALFFPDARGDGAGLHRVLAPGLVLLGLGLAAWVDHTPAENPWNPVLWGLAIWSALVVWVQVVFPFLGNEPARLRLSALIPGSSQVYDLLPDLSRGFRPLDLIVVLGLSALAGWVVVQLIATFRDEPVKRGA